MIFRSICNLTCNMNCLYQNERMGTTKKCSVEMYHEWCFLKVKDNFFLTMDFLPSYFKTFTRIYHSNIPKRVPPRLARQLGHVSTENIFKLYWTFGVSYKLTIQFVRNTLSKWESKQQTTSAASGYYLVLHFKFAKMQ